MDDREIACLFAGYGYQPRIVEDLDNIDADMHATLEWAVEEIRKIQHAARTGNPITKPRWPMIVLRTPKGWGCPKGAHGNIIEGSFRSHQVPLPDAGRDASELASLQEWLASYKPQELFPDGAVTDAIDPVIPSHKFKRLGQNPVSWNQHIGLETPHWKAFSVEQGGMASCLKTASNFLDQALVQNKHSLRIFSPDELVSNKLDKVFDNTSRNFQWDQYSMNKGGQVTEILSEHTCQGKHVHHGVLNSSHAIQASCKATP